MATNPTAEPISSLDIQKLLIALHRIADLTEAILTECILAANPSFTPTGIDPATQPPMPDGSPRPIPKTTIQCKECGSEWTKQHTEQCPVAPGLTVLHAQCVEVPNPHA